ncbi:MAG: 50S ribosomal protein L24 [Planctomycetes bacterium]|jgi:large subunit ribosomal protein L24|nr:50S ribosomal protein L24 [Planctomycetota bacterium]
MKLRKGDDVIVIAGNDKGHTGEVVNVDRQRNRVLISGVNLRTKHKKPTQQTPQGERIQEEVPIHASNVMLVDPATGKGTRKRPAQG